MNTRLVAARVLSRVLQDGQSLTAALDNAFPSIESSKDRAFIQALCYGVCRQYHRLDFILSQLLDKPLKDTDVKALALVGLYQLKFMRVKPHAAVSETVLAARKKPWAKSLINAVLRTYLREQEGLEHKADKCQVAALSHPDWLIKQIEQDWPEQALNIFLENNQQPPMVLRVNLAKTSREDYLQLLTGQDIAAEAVSFCRSAIRLDKPVPVDMLPGFSDGLVSVQDTAAQLAAGLLDVRPGYRVLDVCAAPGGKTAHILESQPQLKELVAVDIDESRMQRISENLQRLNLNATLVVGDAANPASWWDGKPFDRILLDAPCSALGVIRRHPDIKLLRRVEDIGQLQALQKNILQAVWPLLAPGGLMLYATCSILKQENEQQVQAFLAEHSDAVELPLFPSSSLGATDWGINGVCGRQILTGESAMDGFYYACISKQ
ncbi:16S rRNA (cytosine(967)-C(5))-methyltransferase RsmB [Methylobacter sp.]|uniref:16S rRNA (cytosine(967)-C(5))-methyltransferase RsmB n=1 Tax=Methylobacter sp. TaxID=2051955 RepID=UPI0024874A64|nr:16S rRNA (cytosine(967)-C(5))-methyltransferase RsmB [Methylobacter sp.]MDI1276735.1 16S rRNA (cytosine(967)-C(5))-methyltransferase RsmB [Methylobacter sp.]MDI1357403.1 16S rRNA (cytosine(967)-C(5))-methyltransferase RsmB [Methylobacter sp.]